jgi:hypothetical protein
MKTMKTHDKRTLSIDTINPLVVHFQQEESIKKHEAHGRNRQRRGAVGDRPTCYVLGSKIQLDKNLKYRVTLGQHLAAGGGVVCVTFWILGGILYNQQNTLMSIVICISFLVVMAGLAFIFHGNVSLPTLRRLLNEINVVVIMVLITFDMIINIYKPTNWFSPFSGTIFFLEIMLFVFMDAIIRKSRTFMLCASTVVALNTLFNIYSNTIGDANVGVVLFKYEIAGTKLQIHKRSIKRSIYTQIFCFSLTGIITVFKDKKKELMIFAKGNIYRDTGTSSKLRPEQEFVVE